MAIRSVATSDTLETFRTTFNSLGTDAGDLDNLNTTDKTSLVAAVNEAFGATSSFTLRDSSSSTQTITGGDTLNVIGSSNIEAVVSATDTLTISMSSTISGLTSIGTGSLTATSIGTGSLTASGTIEGATITENNVRVATQPFAIAQSIALG